MYFKKIFLFSLVLLSITACFKKEVATATTGTSSSAENFPEVSVKCGTEACVK